jgi:plastocyanin
MRRRPALPVAALLAVALLSLAGCTASAKPAQPALARQSASAPTAAGVQQHDHGQAGQGATGTPAIVPRSGVVKMRVDQPGPTDVEFQWRPGNLVVSPGQSVTLEIANNDYMQHNFLFQAAKVNRNLPVGKVTTVRFTAPSAGTYAFWCKYHLQMMKGSITVR